MMCLCPHVQWRVDEVSRCGRLGICFGEMEIKECFPGGNAFQKNEMCDRFKVDIPYCLNKITCNVIFHADHPEYAPDLILTESSFSVQLQEIKSLCDWNPDDKKSLLHVLKELFTLYRRQQTQLLERHSRLQFEYSSVIHMPGITEDDVEVLMADKNAEGPVHFLIRLPVDLSHLPELITADNPGDDAALLSIIFQSAQGRVTPQLYLSPRLEYALGGSQALRIPSFPSEGCLFDYVPPILTLLQNKIDNVMMSYKKREEYIAAFLSHFGTAVIEFDVYSYSHIALLFEWNDFFFILNIRLSMLFPEEQPAFIFQSVYHTSSGRPFSIKTFEYPYSPRWSANEMAERSRAFVLQYIPQFQDISIANRSA